MGGGGDIGQKYFTINLFSHYIVVLHFLQLYMNEIYNVNSLVSRLFHLA